MFRRLHGKGFNSLECLRAATNNASHVQGTLSIAVSGKHGIDDGLFEIDKLILR